jgi:hypothetical protein
VSNFNTEVEDYFDKVCSSDPPVLSQKIIGKSVAIACWDEFGWFRIQSLVVNYVEEQINLWDAAHYGNQ